jgi:hypothetical protein
MYWLLDNIFVGTNNGNYKIEMSPELEGKRKIIVISL